MFHPPCAHPAEPWTRDRSTHCGDPIISGSREVDRLGPSRINGNKQIGQEKERRKGPPYFAEVRMYVCMYVECRQDRRLLGIGIIGFDAVHLNLANQFGTYKTLVSNVPYLGFPKILRSPTATPGFPSYRNFGHILDFD